MPRNSRENVINGLELCMAQAFKSKKTTEMWVCTIPERTDANQQTKWTGRSVNWAIRNFDWGSNVHYIDTMRYLGRNWTNDGIHYNMEASARIMNGVKSAVDFRMRRV